MEFGGAMINLRERWRAGKPEVFILTGVWVGFVGNAASLPIALVTQPVALWSAAVVTSGAGVGLAGLAAFVLARRAARTARNFVFLGAISTALAVLSLAGLVGGGIALVGATWGVIQTYQPRP